MEARDRCAGDTMLFGAVQNKGQLGVEVVV